MVEEMREPLPTPMGPSAALRRRTAKVPPSSAIKDLVLMSEYFSRCHRTSPDVKSRHVRRETLTRSSHQMLATLPVSQQQVAESFLASFAGSPSSLRPLLISSILAECALPLLSHAALELRPLLRHDVLSSLPTELALRILCFLDARSLCHAAQVSKKWRVMADDDILWHRMCVQHIDRKCPKCGWGLPLLDRKHRLTDLAPESALEILPDTAPEDLPASASDPTPEFASEPTSQDEPPAKRQRLEEGPSDPPHMHLLELPSPVGLHAAYPPNSWKAVYEERLVVERNWRQSRYSTRVLKGHTDGIMCLQISECSNPSLLATGSYDHTARIWNLESGECLKVLRGHTRCVRALHFDDKILVTGSMDKTLKVWSLKTFECIRTLQGHMDGVTSLHFVTSPNNLLVSGSADATIRLWFLGTGKCYTLTGHTDWVNKVQLIPGGTSPLGRVISCSDDMTVRIWDVGTRSCINTLTGHVGPIQCFSTWIPSDWTGIPSSMDKTSAVAVIESDGAPETPSRKDAILVTGSLDNTVKIWNLSTLTCLDTVFGHVEGVWCVALNSLRIVSGAHDTLIKVWDLENSQCMMTLQGHGGSVNCCTISDERVVSGGEEGDICLWEFGVDRS